jgi:hypothetical protein
MQRIQQPAMSAALTKQLRNLIDANVPTSAPTNKMKQETKRQKATLNSQASGMGKRKKELQKTKKVSLKPSKTSAMANKARAKAETRSKALQYYIDSSKESESLLEEKQAVLKKLAQSSTEKPTPLVSDSDSE